MTAFSVTLDADQQRTIDEDPRAPLLLHGQAGFGKTTAALHRVTTLARHARTQGQPFRTLVLVPSLGLRDKWARALAAHHVSAEVDTLDQWLGREARRSFRGLHERDSEHATPGVLRLKRHPAVVSVLEEVAERSGGRIGRDDLFELWGDTRLLADIVDEAGGVLTSRDAADVHAHAAAQFAELDRHEDGSLVLGMMGIPAHEGTPLHDALTLDVEDYAVLFALDRINGGRARPRRFDHVVIDEAQELAPLELTLVGRAVRGGLTVVGDERQQVDPTAWFEGWERSLSAVGYPRAVRIEMRHSHRCPEAVMALARAVSERRPVPARHPPVHVVQSADEAAHVAALAGWAATSRPSGEVTAIVAATPARADRLVKRLPSTLGAVRLDRAPAPRASVVVTTVDRIRGLELDHVAVPELDPEAWPARASTRSALYVALTRATQSVWVGTAGAWSPLFRAPTSRR